MNSNDIINPAPAFYRFYRVPAMTSAAILNCLNTPSMASLTKGLSRLFKGSDGTLGAVMEKTRVSVKIIYFNGQEAAQAFKAM
ncbi:hypothetical protein AYI96_02880 [Shewanella sp. MSW]|nr:hypothetical protein AYI96_02880 [Shewanella sp. MSW]